MSRCEWCECSPCFLDCAERHQAPRRASWREQAQSGVGKEAPPEERQRLLALAKALLRRGVEQALVAEETGLRRDYVSTIAHRLRHGLTGGRKRTSTSPNLP